MSESTSAQSTSASPLVSVIVPAYNSGAYLGAALDSLRAQTLREIEIIVINDGSSDDTAAVAARHAAEDPRVRVISRATPSGRPAVARNAGMREARGRYLALLDADDTSVPTRFAEQVGAMEITGARFAFSDSQRFFEGTGTLEPAGSLALDGFRELAAPYLEHVSGDVYLCTQSFAAFLLTYVAIVTSTVMFSRDLLDGEQTWFDESLVCFEDLDLWLRLAEHTRYVVVDRVHVIMRKHAQSLTGSQPLATRMDGIGVRRKHLERLRPRLSANQLRAAEQNISELQFHVAYAQWCEGRGRHARHWFRESWRSRPTRAAALGYLKAFVPRAHALGMLSRLRSDPASEGQPRR